jgi:hypothetical protein
MKDKTTPTTILVSVSSTFERDKLIKRIYTNLTTEPSTTFIVQQDQVNRIKVFYRVSQDIRVLVRTYLVLVIPILIDFGPLHSIFGTIDFHLDETIKHLTSLTQKLQALQGKRVVKGNVNAKNFENQLDRCLCGTSEEY